MTRWLMILALSLWTAAAAPGFASPALAQAPLDAAKQAGLVGEKPDGLIGFVAGTVPADVGALVGQINAGRLERYAEIAKTNGTSVDSVRAVAGRRLIDRTPAGQFVMTASGAWQRK
ncbi:hypothetical protein N825_11135 [Skermanella stibiiresistens SB22]|uniref:DUF1318 domain-containing protein n=1 Tax=Skermanella stibiiresistens SB22 TaxID=1385369 RepID=W9H4P7_9PROT|nr:YdbL family protein [Skermanella stibiiresistens]EWY38723.1 hypothetical protein N825_11135 [Skermanella stibiiresistens SB22]